MKDRCRRENRDGRGEKVLEGEGEKTIMEREKGKAVMGSRQWRKVWIEDDLDLEKIEKSGQAFRIRRLEGDWYRFVHRGRALYIRREMDLEALEKAEEAGKKEGALKRDRGEQKASQNGEGAGKRGTSYLVSASPQEWEELWVPYLDLGLSYREIREKGEGLHPFLREACESGKGLRILRQDPWEMLVTFIISQRKNIPAITQCVEKLCEAYGEVIEEGEGPFLGCAGMGPSRSLKGKGSFAQRGETIFSFPQARALAGAGEEELRGLGLGYRAPYVASAAKMVSAGELDLKALEREGDEELLKALMQVKGVGVKVANCVALFGYQRYGCAPVDVWIARAIEKEWGGKNPFPEMGEHAGIYQQYVFYYIREREGRLKKEKGQ